MDGFQHIRDLIPSEEVHVLNLTGVPYALTSFMGTWAYNDRGKIGAFNTIEEITLETIDVSKNVLSTSYQLST